MVDWVWEGPIGDDGLVTEPTVSAPAPAGPPPSRYTLGTMPNMLRSMAVIVALMALVFFMMPRINSVSQPPVDVLTNAEVVRDTTGWPIEVPEGLPKGWQPTAVRYVKSTGGLMTWHVGYQTPAGTYVALEQTQGATDDWVRAQTNRAPAGETRTIEGTTWTSYVREDKKQNSLVDRPSDANALTTVVTGTGDFEELTEFVEHLVPVPAD